MAKTTKKKTAKPGAKKSAKAPVKKTAKPRKPRTKKIVDSVTAPEVQAWENGIGVPCGIDESNQQP